MSKKSIKEAATAGTSVFNQLASGNIAENLQDIQGVPDVKPIKDAKDAKDTKHVKYNRDTDKHGIPLERLNLKIPTSIKEYLTVAAAKESINRRANVSVTTYLVELIKRDMELHKDE